MSTDLTKPIEVLNPATGEVLALDAPTEDLGRLLADIREYELLLREVKRTASRELLARFDRAACWTVHAGDFKLKGASPKPAEEFDGASLRAALLELVDQGLLTAEAVDVAVETVVTFKPRQAGINALRKLGGHVAEVVNSHATPVERERYVTVSRA